MSDGLGQHQSSFLTTPTNQQIEQESSPNQQRKNNQVKKLDFFSTNSLKGNSSNNYSYNIDDVTDIFSEPSPTTKKKGKKSKKDGDENDEDPYLHLVKRCSREEIWPTTKFLDEESINKMKMGNHDGFKKSVIGLLLKRCMLEQLEPLGRLQFWKRYSKSVKEELNKMKTNTCKNIKMDVKNGKKIYSIYICHFLKFFYHMILTTLLLLFLISALQKENMKGNFSVKNEESVRGFGPTPRSTMGAVHHLIEKAWKVGQIETIYDCIDNEVIYQYMNLCVSHSCGRRKWNSYSTMKPLSSFITPMDEAFAMIMLENNASKWLDELYLMTARKKDRRKALYTEEEGAKRWSLRGKCRYMQLVLAIGKYRKENNQRWAAIEEMVKEREIESRGLVNVNCKKRKREDHGQRDAEDDGENSKTGEQSNHDTMLNLLTEVNNGASLEMMIDATPNIETTTVVPM